jgi:hypothetical protein
MNSDESDPEVRAGPDDSAPEEIARRRAILFTMLSCLWVFPSLGALWILFSNPTLMRGSLTFMDRLRSIRVEDVCSMLLLILHAAFGLLAWRHHRRHWCRRMSAEKSGQGGK